MLKKIKLALISFSALFMFAVPLATAGVANAAISQDQINQNLCNGTNGSFSTDTSGTCGDEASGKVDDLVKTIVNIISIAVGIVAVIMIIVGGFRYVTSGGKQESVTAAKSTILYALIGLIIVALAQIIVHFVLNKTTTAGS